jgi:LmbE family N-acetylglucosaminyl deacetylase
LTDGNRGGRTKKQAWREALKSAEKLGVFEVIFLGISDTKVQHDSETIQKIEKVIKKVNPDIIYTHHPIDSHQDHIATYNCTISAGRNVPTIITYEDVTSIDFIPNLFIDISPYLNKKIESLKCFKSQGHKEFMKTEAIEGLARFRGFQAKTKYAEAFHIVRMVKK